MTKEQALAQQLKMPAWITVNAKSKNEAPMSKEKIDLLYKIQQNDFPENDNIYAIIDKMTNDFSLNEESDCSKPTVSVKFLDHKKNDFIFPIIVFTSTKNFKFRPGPWWKEMEEYLEEVAECYCSSEDELYRKYVKVKKLKAFE